MRVWAGCDVILSDTAAAVPFVHTASALLALLTPPPSGVSRSLSPPGVSGNHVGCRGTSLAPQPHQAGVGARGRVSGGLSFGAQDSGTQSRAAFQAHPVSGSGSADLPATAPRGPVTRPRSHSRAAGEHRSGGSLWPARAAPFWWGPPPAPFPKDSTPEKAKSLTEPLILRLIHHLAACVQKAATRHPPIPKD